VSNHECVSRGIVKRTLRNGAVTFVDQCRECGRQMRAHKKQEATELSGFWLSGLWDESIAEKWQERWRREWQAEADKRDQARAEQDRLWWEEYNRYINSAEWSAIKYKVLKRANRICEGCGENAAWHVHHCTYKNAFDPFMFELVALCEPCHSRVHGRAVGEEAA